MSAQISKINPEKSERTSAAQTRAPVQPPPSQTKPHEEALNIPDEPSTSYAAMLREAYDGDTAEAMAVVANARRTGETNGEKAPVLPAEMPHEKTGARRVTPVNRDEKASQVLDGLRSRKNAGPVAAGQPVARGQNKPPSAKRSHDQLMLASSKMGVSEVATHVSLRSFISLTRILSQHNWLRERACVDNLMRAHMSSLQETGIR